MAVVKVSQNVFKVFPEAAAAFPLWQVAVFILKMLASRLDQTDLNQFLKVPIHVFPIYNPR